MGKYVVLGRVSAFFCLRCSGWFAPRGSGPRTEPSAVVILRAVAGIEFERSEEGNKIEEEGRVRRIEVDGVVANRDRKMIDVAVMVEYVGKMDGLIIPKNTGKG